MRVLLAVFLAAAPGFAYLHNSRSGHFAHRADQDNVQFLLSQNVAPGLLNRDGAVWITPDSDVLGAINAVMQTWSSIPGVSLHFAPLKTTDVNVAANDGSHVILFTDSDEERAAIGNALAITTYFLASDGTLTDTDIQFSPKITVSTTQQPGTYDLGSILTHEMGHALGAGHSGFLSSTMFQSIGVQNTSQEQLKPDDVAFAIETYGNGVGYGTISGAVTYVVGGYAVNGALLAAVDPVTGISVGGISGIDGTFSFIAPPGHYVLYAEPLSGQVQPINVGLKSSVVNSDFGTTALGGFDQPTLVNVEAGGKAQVAIAVPISATPFNVQYSAAISLGNFAPFYYTGADQIAWNSSMEVRFSGPGLGNITEDGIRIYGPLTLRKASLNTAAGVLSSGTPIISFVVDVPDRTTPAQGTVVVTTNGTAAAFSAGLELIGPAPSFPAAGVTNSFSYANAAIAPGEIVSLFGLNLGPTLGVPSTGFAANGFLSTSLGNVTVTFDGVAAPIFYAGSGQVNVEVPFEIAGLRSTNVAVQYGNFSSASVTVPVALAVPGLFPSAINYASRQFNTASNPVSRGAYVVLYATGLGVSQGVRTGQQVSSALTIDNVSVVLGGKTITPSFAGQAPGFTGLNQVNLQIPSDTPTGQIDVMVRNGDAGSQTIKIWVQ